MSGVTWQRDLFGVCSSNMSIESSGDGSSSRKRGKRNTERVNPDHLEQLRNPPPPLSGISLVIYCREGVLVRAISGNETVVIGRGESKDPHFIAISDPTLSWEHAQFIRHGEHLDVEDLGSFNGTYVVGQKIGGRTRLFPGAEVQMGSVVLVVTSGLRNQPSLLPHSRFVAAVQEEAERAMYYGRDFAVLMIRAGQAENLDVRRFLPDVLKQLRPIHYVAVHSKDTVEVLLPEANDEEARMVANMLVPPHPKRGPQREHSPLFVSGIVCGMARGSTTMFEVGTLLNETLALLPGGVRSENPRIERRTAKGDGSGISGSNETDKLLLQPAFLKRLGKVDRIACSNSPILLIGETGVGKSEIARWFHAHSSRSAGPLVPVNCAAIPDGLLESELFGQVEGAFTGAKTKAGLFELADSGTLFLDEIGDLSPSAQAKILEAVQRGEFRRVGATKTIKVDVRLITATNKDLLVLVKRKQFREDLFFRLKEVVIEIPPLRERKDEIEGLATWLLRRRIAKDKLSNIQGFSQAALALFQVYPWPGNVRELDHVIGRAVAQTDHALLQAEDFPDLLNKDERSMSVEKLAGLPESEMVGWAVKVEKPNDEKPTRLRKPSGGNDSRKNGLEQYLREEWLGALVQAGGSRKKAAELLGMPERTFYHQRKKLNITPREIKAWLDAGGKSKEEKEEEKEKEE